LRLKLPSLRILNRSVHDEPHLGRPRLLGTCLLSHIELWSKLDCDLSPVQDALLNRVFQHFSNQEFLMRQFVHPKDGPVRHELLISPYELLQKPHLSF